MYIKDTSELLTAVAIDSQVLQSQCSFYCGYLIVCVQIPTVSLVNKKYFMSTFMSFGCQNRSSSWCNACLSISPHLH